MQKYLRAAAFPKYEMTLLVFPGLISLLLIASQGPGRLLVRQTTLSSVLKLISSLLHLLVTLRGSEYLMNDRDPIFLIHQFSDIIIIILFISIHMSSGLCFSCVRPGLLSSTQWSLPPECWILRLPLCPLHWRALLRGN